jgi:UDP-glucose 4-epimerase
VPYASFSKNKYEDVMRRVPDTSFSEEILGTSAKVSLDEGLKKTIAWQKQAVAERGFGLN